MKTARYAAWGGMFVFGVSVALLGATLPLLAARAHFDLAAAGLLFFVLNAAVVVCTLSLGSSVDRHGPRAAMVAGPLLVAFAMLAVASAKGFAIVIGAAALLGVGGGLLNVATNTLTAGLSVEPLRKNAELNRLGIFFGLGALLVPLGLGSLLERWGMEPVLWLAASLCAAVGLASAALPLPGPAPSSATVPSRPWTLLREPWVATAALLLFLQSGNEMILTGYATAHLTNFASVAQASWAVSGMWAAVIAARAALAWLASRVSGEFIVVGSAVLTGAGTLWLLVAAHFLPAAAALALTGAAMAGIFPTTMGMAGARFAGRTGAVFGVMLAVARSGAMLMPWLAGSLAERSGTRAAIGVALACAGGILFLALRLHRIPPAPEC